MSNPYAPVRPVAHQPGREVNVLAIVGFILSFVVTLAGIVLGIIALVQIRRTHARGTGLAVAAVVLGAVLTFSWIVVLLAAIAIPVFFGQQSAAEDAATESGLANAKIAMLTYATENNGTYPADIVGLDAEGFTQTPATSNARIVDGGAGGYFCIQATSQAGHPFHVTSSAGVETGLCPL